MDDEGQQWSELENMIHDAAGPKVSWGAQKTVADAIRGEFGGDEPSADMLAAIGASIATQIPVGLESLGPNGLNHLEQGSRAHHS